MPVSIQPLDTSYYHFHGMEESPPTTPMNKLKKSSLFSKAAFKITVALLLVVVAGIAILLYFVLRQKCQVYCEQESERLCVSAVGSDEDVVPTLHQEFGFASYYQTNMVLQREPHRSNIWGYGIVGATVNISMNGKVYSTTVVTGPEDGGVWSVRFNPQPAGTRTAIEGVHDDHASLQTANIFNILFGDVFICSGQSNMHMTLSTVNNSCEELEQTQNYPDIRVFTVKVHDSTTPRYDLAVIEQSWTVPSPETMTGPAHFSGLCWLYGKYLYDELGIPIGLVASSRDSTPIESWISGDVIDMCRSTGNQTIYESKTYDYTTYNAMLHPLFNMTIVGAVWYQGESNALLDSELYQCMFTNLIKHWRQRWYEGSHMTTNPDFPFGFVQIGGVATIYPNYPQIRWYQTASYGYAPNPEMGNTFMAVAMDLPDPDSPHGSIHPRYKQDIALRLVEGALKSIYNRTVVNEGPFPDEAVQIDGNRIIIQYPSSQQITVADHGHFEICCLGSNCSVTDQELDARWRTATILEYSNNTITLGTEFCEDDARLVDQIRYAWELNPCAFKQCSVYNEFGFPGAPFILSVNHEVT